MPISPMVLRHKLRRLLFIEIIQSPASSGVVPNAVILLAACHSISQFLNKPAANDRQLRSSWQWDKEAIFSTGEDSGKGVAVAEKSFEYDTDLIHKLNIDSSATSY